MPAVNPIWQDHQSTCPRSLAARGAYSGTSVSLPAPLRLLIIRWEHAVRILYLQQILHLLSGEGTGSPQLVLEHVVSHHQLMGEGENPVPGYLPGVSHLTSAAVCQVEGEISDGI